MAPTPNLHNDIKIALPLTIVIIPVIKHKLFYIYTTAGDNKKKFTNKNCINLTVSQSPCAYLTSFFPKGEADHRDKDMNLELFQFICLQAIP